MMSFTIMAILIVVAIVLIKMNHFRHKMTILALLVLVLFLYTTATVVNKANELDLTTTDGFFDAIKVYMGWLGNGFQNLKSISANAVKMDWRSTNGTFISEKVEAIKK